MIRKKLNIPSDVMPLISINMMNSFVKRSCFTAKDLLCNIFRALYSALPIKSQMQLTAFSTGNVMITASAIMSFKPSVRMLLLKLLAFKWMRAMIQSANSAYSVIMSFRWHVKTLNKVNYLKF